MLRIKRKTDTTIISVKVLLRSSHSISAHFQESLSILCSPAGLHLAPHQFTNMPFLFLPLNGEESSPRKVLVPVLLLFQELPFGGECCNVLVSLLGSG